MLALSVASPNDRMIGKHRPPAAAAFACVHGITPSTTSPSSSSSSSSSSSLKTRIPWRLGQTCRQLPRRTVPHCHPVQRLHLSLNSLLISLFFLTIIHPSVQVHAAPYTYLSYAELHARLAQLAYDHPQLLTLTSAQDLYHLTYIGTCTEFPGSPPNTSQEPAPSRCRIWVATLTNHTSLPNDPFRPEAVVSGELHGDERIGPHAVLAYIELIINAVQRGDPNAIRTVNTRTLTFLPMTNAIGYFSNERGERHDTGTDVIDPNRDFAFGQDPAKCMVTMAARAVNELFRNHIFRLMITFHGGANAIGYEWGDMSHCKGSNCTPAPDTLIMDALARRMSAFAGPAGPYEQPYPTGDMGKLVYPVHGGMEDWAYGASWSSETITCSPRSFNGYPPEHTFYGNTTNRCVTFLVETGTVKAPAEYTLGDSDAVLAPGFKGDGHVPRNVRLLMAAIDAIEPYIVFNGDPVLSSKAGPSLSSNETFITFSWSVGGAFFVDGTFLQWSTRGKNLRRRLNQFYGTSPVLNGTAGAALVGADPTIFQAVLPIREITDDFCFRAAAVVDTELRKTPDNSDPIGGVQSHLMGSRMGPSWNFSIANGTRRLQGRTVFYSDTIQMDLTSGIGQANFVMDNSLSWGRENADLIADADEDTAKILTGQSPRKDPVLPPLGSSSMNYSLDSPKLPSGNTGGTGSDATFDPRDKDAFVSGVIGVVAILGVTLWILYKMWQNREQFIQPAAESEFTIANGEDMIELKEPLHPHDFEGAEVPGTATRVPYGASEV